MRSKQIQKKKNEANYPAILNEEACRFIRDVSYDPKNLFLAGPMREIPSRQDGPILPIQPSGSHS